MVDISILMGSESDHAIATRVTSVLEGTDYSFDVEVISAHRDPENLKNTLLRAMPTSSLRSQVFLQHFLVSLPLRP